MSRDDDWYPGVWPRNIDVHDEACAESSYSFARFRSQRVPGLVMRRGSALYGTVLDVGESGRVILEEYAMVTSAYLCCDVEIHVGPHVMISWGAVLMDHYRGLKSALQADRRVSGGIRTPRPIRLERNCWVGFEACVLPGVTIGENSIVGARAVVFSDVPPNAIAVGNPARIIERPNCERAFG